MSEDFLICLNRGAGKGVEGAGREWLQRTIDQAERGAKASVRVVWAEKDGLISTRSQGAFARLMGSQALRRR